MILLLVVLFFIMCFLRVPIAFALSFSSLIVIWRLGISFQQVVVHTLKGLESFPLLAVPFFLLSGALMTESKMAEQLLRFSNAIVGRFRGGLAHVNVLVSMIFAGVSGSSTADTSGVSGLLVPPMIKEGFSPEFTAAITAASSVMGNIIPPSIYMVMYGSMAGVSVGALFLAGFIPGVLVGLSQMWLAYREAKRTGLEAHEGVPLKGVAKEFVLSIPVLMVGVIIVGGVIGGVFTPTEAAAISVVYILVMSVLVYKTIRPSELPAILIRGGRSYALTLFLIASASVFGWLIAYLDGPRMVSQWMMRISSNPRVILLLVSGMLLITGTFLSEIATIMIFTPLFTRLAQLCGIHPIQMGIVVVMMLCLGLVTPPYGVCLLIAADMADVNLMTATRATLPFIVAFLAIVAIVIFWPDLVLVIPRLVMPRFV